MSWIDFEVFSYLGRELVVRHFSAERKLEDVFVAVSRNSWRKSYDYAVQEVVVELSSVSVSARLRN